MGEEKGCRGQRRWRDLKKMQRALACLRSSVSPGHALLATASLDRVMGIGGTICPSSRGSAVVGYPSSCCMAQAAPNETRLRMRDVEYVCS